MLKTTEDTERAEERNPSGKSLRCDDQLSFPVANATHCTRTDARRPAPTGQLNARVRPQPGLGCRHASVRELGLVGAAPVRPDPNIPAFPDGVSGLHHAPIQYYYASRLPGEAAEGVNDGTSLDEKTTFQ